MSKKKPSAKKPDEVLNEKVSGLDQKDDLDQEPKKDTIKPKVAGLKKFDKFKKIEDQKNDK